MRAWTEAGEWRASVSLLRRCSGLERWRLTTGPGGMLRDDMPDTADEGDDGGDSSSRCCEFDVVHAGMLIGGTRLGDDWLLVCGVVL